VAYWACWLHCGSTCCCCCCEGWRQWYQRCRLLLLLLLYLPVCHRPGGLIGNQLAVVDCCRTVLELQQLLLLLLQQLLKPLWGGSSIPGLDSLLDILVNMRLHACSCGHSLSSLLLLLLVLLVLCRAMQGHVLTRVKCCCGRTTGSASTSSSSCCCCLCA
jgi:hypothetical protein